MINRTVTAIGLTAAALGTALAAATTATAGGIGDFLSPAFGTLCANHNTGARASGVTTHGTGAANGNLAGLPLGSAVNQCGGADIELGWLSGSHASTSNVDARHFDAGLLGID